MADKDTLYDEVIKKIKNNKRLVGIMIVATIFVAVLTFLGTVLEKGSTIKDVFFPQKEQIQIVVSIKPYDLISEANQTQAASTQFFTLGNDVDIESVSSSIVSKILTYVQPRNKPELDLELINNSLHVHEPVVASISYFQSPIQSLLIKEFDENSDLSLGEFFQYTDFYNPACNCISLYIKDAAGQLKPSFLQIFKNEQGYSFELESLVVNISVKSEMNPTIILITPFKISGTNEQTGKQISSLLDVTLRQDLSKSNFIRISALTLEEVQKKREELKNLPISPDKPDLVEQYNVDFIVSVEIIVTNEP